MTAHQTVLLLACTESSEAQELGAGPEAGGDGGRLDTVSSYQYV